MRTDICKTVLALGDAPEAQAIVGELTALGYDVQWLRGSSVGMDELATGRVTLWRDAALVGLEGQVGGFVARVRVEGELRAIPAQAVVVAIGNERYSPLSALGLPAGPRVLTASQMRRRLQERPATGASLPQRKARYLLWLDPSDPARKEPAVEMLELARDLSRQWRSEALVVYRDLLVDTMPLERLTRELRQRGVVFSRTDAATVAIDEDGVTVTASEGPLRGDYLVLPEGARPHPDTVALAALLQVRLGADGYFQDINVRQLRAGWSSRKGIYFVGRCHLDADLATALADATQVAARVDALLRDGPQPEPIVAQVEAHKCIRCLTCVRTCPHAAVQIVEAEDVIAAQVSELACWGCGACVANCPVQAIAYRGASLPSWIQTAEVRA